VVEKAKTAFEKFRLLTKRLVGVPKAAADKQEKPKRRA